MNKIRNINDVVWWATYENKEVSKQCIVCYGKKEVTLVLGNGDNVTLPCSYCGTGYEEPRGYTREYEFVSNVQQIAIDKVSIEKTLVGDIVEYSYGCYCLRPDMIFDTKEEAEEKIKTLIAARIGDENTKSEHIKKDKYKSFTWNAGYHMREAKKAKEQVEYHEKKAILCKERSKKEVI